MKKLISIITPTFNEENNIEKIIFKIENIMNNHSQNYDYEHIVIDNNSLDKTPNILRKVASKKKNLKVILNSKNFGQSRSPFYALLQSRRFLLLWQQIFKILLS